MPIYEYRCDDCGEVCEILVRGEETPVCEKCGGNKLTRIFSTTAPPSDAGPNCAARDMGLCDGTPHSHGAGCGCGGCCGG